MIFQPTKLAGVFTVEIEPARDDRGFFGRVFVVEEFAAQGLPTVIDHVAVSNSPQRGTLRGLHYQVEPHVQPKLIRCTRGAVYDVAVDVRPDSPTYRQWVAVELSAETHRSIFTPAGVAHGWLTLTPDSECQYLFFGPRVAEAERGMRWDDPALAIDWPFPARVISERDATYPDFAP